MSFTHICGCVNRQRHCRHTECVGQLIKVTSLEMRQTVAGRCNYSNAKQMFVNPPFPLPVDNWRNVSASSSH